jgi:O-antigen/teichoic acid export membrane protein
MLFVTIITGSGHPNAAMLLSFAVLGLDYALNVFLVPKYALIGAAAATTLASAFGLIIASFYTFRLFRVLTYPGSFLKISFSAAVIYIISLYVQLSGLALIMEYIVLFLIYTILLFILKELKKEDIQRVLGLIGAGYGRKI